MSMPAAVDTPPGSTFSSTPPTATDPGAGLGAAPAAAAAAAACAAAAARLPADGAYGIMEVVMTVALFGMTGLALAMPGKVPSEGGANDQQCVKITVSILP